MGQGFGSGKCLRVGVLDDESFETPKEGTVQGSRLSPMLGNSLQMGFKTLAIEKRSSEVWRLLAAVKTEWGKYGDIHDRIQKKLHEVSNVVSEVRRKTRTIGRKLKGVQELPVREMQDLLGPGEPEEVGLDEALGGECVEEKK